MDPTDYKRLYEEEKRRRETLEAQLRNAEERFCLARQYVDETATNLAEMQSQCEIICRHMKALFK